VWTYVWQCWKLSLSFCCIMFQHWINTESFPVSQLSVNTLPAIKITLITNGIYFGSLSVNYDLLCFFQLTSNTFHKCTATFRTHCIIHIYIQVQYTLFLLNFIQTWIFSMELRKIFKHQISWKSVLWELSFSKAGRWTDRSEEANSSFSQFCENA
jgi:hypothetical protein